MFKKAFTIVELLIVIVVIGILAAVIIVSYIGITQSAVQSQSQANAVELNRALSVYKTRNSNGELYPLGTNHGGSISSLRTLANIPQNIEVDAYLTDSTGNNYCITTATGSGGVTSTYSVSSTSSIPIHGMCVENLIFDPGARSCLASGGNYWGIWAGGGGGVGSLTCPTVTWSVSGKAARNTWSVANSDYSGDIGWVFPYASGSTILQPNTTYTITWGIVVSKNQSIRAEASNWKLLDNNTNNSGTGTKPGGTGQFSVAAGVPSRPWISITMGSGTYGAKVYTGLNSGGSFWQPGDWIEASDFMAVVGSTKYSYGDGDQPGWFWTGVPNKSTSIGPSIAQ